MELDIQSDYFMCLVNYRLKNKKIFFDNVPIYFVECNQEQLFCFSQKLELSFDIHAIFVLVDERHHQKEIFLEKTKPADLITTTFFPLKEIQYFLSDQNKRIIVMTLDPQIEPMTLIALSASLVMSMTIGFNALN